MPEIVLMNVDASLGRNEPDLRASVGLNLALDYLPGSMMFDPAARNVADAQVASGAVWFDAFITNVDRTARNPKLLARLGNPWVDLGIAYRCAEVTVEFAAGGLEGSLLFF